MIDSETFLMLIPKGSDSRITSSEIETLTGMKGSAIRATVNELRSSGNPIASDKNGYYIATTTAELEHTIRQLESRIKSINKARNGLLDAAFNLIFQEGK